MDKQTDFKEFKKILVGLAELFPKELKPTTYVMYFAALSDLTIEQVNLAANRWARIARSNDGYPAKFPVPGDLRALATDTSDQLTAGDAWGLVIKHISRWGSPATDCGSNDRPSLPPSVARAVQGVGGLDAIGMCENGLDTIRAHFLRCYRENQEQETQRELLGEPTQAEAKQIMGNLVKKIPAIEGI